MSTIAIHGVPSKWQRHHLVLALAKTTKQQFEVLLITPGRKPLTTAYVRVLENPQRFIKIINRAKPRRAKLTASLSNNDLNMVIKLPKRGRKIPIETQRMLKMHVQRNDTQVHRDTHLELLTELQLKYSSLYSLSTSMGNRLMEEISKIISNRLRQIAFASPDRLQSCFNLSSGYRRKYPHSTDFDLILSTLHQLEDEAGVPRTQLSQETMSRAPKDIFMLRNIPFSKFINMCKNYRKRINERLKDYINNLSTDLDGAANTQKKARIRIREELKKALPSIESIVIQKFNWQFHPAARKVPVHHKIHAMLRLFHTTLPTSLNTYNSAELQGLKRFGLYLARHEIYGEPSLPSKGSLRGFLRKCHAKKIRRSDGIYNMVYFVIPRQMYAACIKLDGTTIENCTLVVRCAETPMHKK